MIYAVTTAGARRDDALDDLVGATGGRALKVKASGELRGAFQNILNDFRSRYILSYTPTGVAQGGFHHLDSRVKRRGLNVNARPGYIGAGSGR